MDIDPSFPVGVYVTAHTPEWIGDNSDGKAAKSVDEKRSPKINVQDISLQNSKIAFSTLPPPSATASSSK